MGSFPFLCFFFCLVFYFVCMENLSSSKVSAQPVINILVHFFIRRCDTKSAQWWHHQQTWVQKASLCSSYCTGPCTSIEWKSSCLRTSAWFVFPSLPEHDSIWSKTLPLASSSHKQEQLHISPADSRTNILQNKR